MNYTPGPWKMFPKLYKINGYRIKIYAEHVKGAICFMGRHSYKQQLADASLIVNALTMLEALKIIADTLDGPRGFQAEIAQKVLDQIEGGRK